MDKSCSCPWLMRMIETSICLSSSSQLKRFSLPICAFLLTVKNSDEPSLVYCFFNHMWNSTYDFASFVHWIERNSQMGIGKLFRLILFMYLVWYWLIYDRESTVSDRKKCSSAMARDVAYHVSSWKLETSHLSLQHHIYHHIHYCNFGRLARSPFYLIQFSARFNWLGLRCNTEFWSTCYLVRHMNAKMWPLLHLYWHLYHSGKLIQIMRVAWETRTRNCLKGRPAELEMKVWRG